jgi:hypothetical protein
MALPLVGMKIMLLPAKCRSFDFAQDDKSLRNGEASKKGA